VQLPLCGCVRYGTQSPAALVCIGKSTYRRHPFTSFLTVKFEKTFPSHEYFVSPDLLDLALLMADGPLTSKVQVKDSRGDPHTVSLHQKSFFSKV
jgi:hypothetical protein